MSLYVYVKAPPQRSEINNNVVSNRFNFRPKLKKALPYLFFASGITMIFMVIWPMVSYKLLISSKEKSKLISPIAESGLAEGKGYMNPLGGSVLSAGTEEPDIDDEVDYNLVQNWFPTAPLPRVKESKITHYSISIPKLKIKDAVVTIGGREVKKTLIHYPGTALPGEYGNTVIFGHSVLPVFYNPKDYKAIFSLIPKLEKGDDIFIYFDGIEYVYTFENYFEVKPDLVQVLEQRFNEQVLSLITCVPPGTYLRRGVVKARLKTL